ncbi:MAG TPA: antitoxin MazE family protein [Paraburkholderia sp.]|nr:antitoxin MazE family protein [Paraburkholderia sp.]
MTTTNARARKHRDGLRESGLRPVQIWVPDTRRAGFAEECRRQSMLAAKYESPEIDQFLEEAAGQIEGWE